MATQAGQRISDPNELSTLKEGDLARVGKDIYRRDLAKEQKFAETWEGGRGTDASELAFRTGVYAPVAPQTQKTAPVEPQVIDKGALIGNVQKSFDKFTGSAGANKAFIEGAFKAGGKLATEEDIAKGGTLSEVIGRAGIGGDIQGFGLEQTKTEDTPLGGVTDKEGVTEQPKTAQEKIVDLLGGIGTRQAELKATAREEVGLTEKSQAIADAQENINNIRTELENQQIIDIKEFDELRGKPLLRSTIGIRMEELSREQKFDLMITQNNYNNALVSQQIAQGNYDRAQSIVQQTADDSFQNFQFQLQALEAQGQLEAQDAKAMETQAMFERDLGLSGFAPLTPEQASTMREADTWEDPVTGKFYRRPEAEGLTRKEQLAEVKSELEIEKLMKEISGVGDFQLDPKDRMDAELKIGNHFDSISKENMTSVRNIGIIETGWQEIQRAVREGESLNAPSQAMLVTFQKMLDPTSVVRESEYGRSADGSSLINRVQGAFEKLKQGGAGVTENDLKTFYTMSKELQKGYQGSLVDMARRTRKQAGNYNLNLENILTPNVLNMLEGADYTTPEDVIGGVVDVEGDWDWD